MEKHNLSLRCESSREKGDQQFLEAFAVFRLTLPYRQDSPAGSSQRSFVAKVALAVAVDLCTPECRVRPRQGRTLASLMSMPEAAVHKDDAAKARKYDVRGSWQGFPVQPESVAKPMGDLSNQHLGRGVLRADCPHIGASCSAGPMFRLRQISFSASRKQPFARRFRHAGPEPKAKWRSAVRR